MPGFELIEQPLLSRALLDRREDLRDQPTALAAGWAGAGVVRVTRRGQVLVSTADPDQLELVLAPTTGRTPSAAAVFLGVIATGTGERHVWGVRDDTIAELVDVAVTDLTDLRAAAHQLDPVSAELVAVATALLNWHDAARFSPYDGTLTTPAKGGWVRVHATSGREEFPRTDPAIICLVSDGADRVVLARQQVWPPRRFSVLAGFVEAGEALETCVVREIREEVGLDITEVRYLGSQPWPFPRSLMLGFHAIADPAQPFEYIDGEIAEARWFTRDQVRHALQEGDWGADSQSSLLLPGSISIARGMLEAWAAGD